MTLFSRTWFAHHWIRLRLLLIQCRDRARLRRLQRIHPGLQIHPTASSALAVATFDLAPGARLEIGANVVCERRPDGVRIAVGEGARVVIGANTWLRTDVEPTRIFAYGNGEILIGKDCFLNGCHLSAKQSLKIGQGSWVGMGTRIFDADQHVLDKGRPEKIAPVKIGDFCWVAADVTIMRGVEIGDHCVIGSGSLVTRSIPAHSLAYGRPAERKSEIVDRSEVPI